MSLSECDVSDVTATLCSFILFHLEALDPFLFKLTYIHSLKPKFIWMAPSENTWFLTMVKRIAQHPHQEVMPDHGVAHYDAVKNLINAGLSMAEIV